MQIIVTDDNRATWQQRLDEAEAAMHNLRTGVQAVTVDTPDDKVTYQMANKAELERYIMDIRRALGLISQVRPSRRRVSFV